MAVEKMKLVSSIFLKQDIEPVLDELILSGSLHLTGESLTENFTMQVLETRNLDLVKKLNLDTSVIRPFTETAPVDYNFFRDRFASMFEFLNINVNSALKSNFEKLDTGVNLNDFYKLNDEFEALKSDFETALSKKKHTKNLFNISSYLMTGGAKNTKISSINDMKYINYIIGKMPKPAFENLRANYENIDYVVIHLGPDITDHDSSQMEMVSFFYYKGQEAELDNLLKSFNFENLDISEFKSIEEGTLESFHEKIIELEKSSAEDVANTEKEKAAFLEKHAFEIINYFYKFKILEKASAVKAYIIQTERFFIITGFVPESKANSLQSRLLTSVPDMVFAMEDASVVSNLVKIPTKLKNPPLIRPFEALVNMYSVPDYKEHDPTAFLAITYMLLFGMMFGDLGQGLVFFAVGTFLKKKIGEVAGIVQSIGISSSIFGLLYGSVFGLENIIPALFIRPMENVTTILIISIILGVALLSIAYFVGFSNLAKQGEKSALLLSKNGIAGFVFYIAFLTFILNFVLGKNLGSDISGLIKLLTVAIMIISGFLMTMETELAPKIFKADIYAQPKEKSSGVEKGFELFETIMSYFSNTLSFIRVGAFAINHVGLFMAFHSLGQMTGSAVVNVIMIILGNIVILVLEGLIVSIQAIRLEYYELFSKYFKGDGVMYDPVKIMKTF